MPFVSPEFTVTKIRKRRYRLEHDMAYKGKDDCWTVPAGSETDYASVPAAVRWLFPQDDDYTQAAILHDWFCDHGIREGLISARDADAVFRRVMRELGVPFARRWVLWTGVRLGAVFNPIRNDGVWRDLPLVILISILVSPLVVPPSLFVFFASMIEMVFNKIVGYWIE